MKKDRAHDTRRVAQVVAGGSLHTVYKEHGDVIVDHAGKNDPKWDKINLTEKAGAKSVEEGAKDVREWHNDHPEHGKKKK
jgi:hypothetical protein